MGIELALAIWAAFAGIGTWASWPEPVLDCAEYAEKRHEEHTAAHLLPYEMGQTEDGDGVVVYIDGGMKMATIDVYTLRTEAPNEHFSPAGQCTANGDTYHHFRAVLPVRIQTQEI